MKARAFQDKKTVYLKAKKPGGAQRLQAVTGKDVKGRMTENKDCKGDRDSRWWTPCESDTFSVNSGKSLKDFTKKGNLTWWLFEKDHWLAAFWKRITEVWIEWQSSTKGPGKSQWEHALKAGKTGRPIRSVTEEGESAGFCWQCPYECEGGKEGRFKHVSRFWRGDWVWVNQQGTSRLLQWLRIHRQFRSHKRLGLDPWVGKIPRRRSWQPSPVFLPGGSHGQRSLAGYSSWGHKESDRTGWLTTIENS